MMVATIIRLSKAPYGPYDVELLADLASGLCESVLRSVDLPVGLKAGDRVEVEMYRHLIAKVVRILP